MHLTGPDIEECLNFALEAGTAIACPSVKLCLLWEKGFRINSPLLRLSLQDKMPKPQNELEWLFRSVGFSNLAVDLIVGGNCYVVA